MRSRRNILAALAVLALAALTWFGCGSSDSGGPTTPPPGGGTTLAFSFPAQNTSRLHVFTEAGVFNYRCGPHGGSGMTGTVTVNAGSTEDSAVVSVGSGGLNFAPSNVTIKVGAYVRWVNVSGLTNHTVTYP